ncbi:cytochrome P450 [Periconia macrospinosa]|uniref:Cytochrome P450 n=1 Tax=Periconia macrospinosa TaxID=97972 RepID=A0A2V1DD63_9PLEO|nr:cytochrome P450 [Periconia macrospinosa]
MFRQMQEHVRMKSVYGLFRHYGHTYQSFPFGRRSVSTIHPQNLQMLFTEHDKFGVGPLRERASEPMIGPGIVSSDGAAWAHARTMLKPTFNKSEIADRGMFSTHMTKFLQLLPSDNSVVDLQPLFDRLILDASSEFIFGVGQRVMLGKLDFLMRDQRFWESCAFIRQYTHKHIDLALKILREDNPPAGRRKHILAQELVQATDDGAVVCDQLLNMVFAGRDTPAVTLTSIFFCIARSPSSWSKIRDEIKGLQDEDLTFDRLKSLRYVQSVIKEAMRLYPPVANTSRSCKEAAILPVGGGQDGLRPVYLHPGDSVNINIYSLHRSEVYYPDPEAFRPERCETIRPTWEYLPLGGDPRQCPAQQLALFWVAYTVVKMAMIYKEVQNHDPVEEFVENMKLNMESLNGARVKLIAS